MRNSKIIFVPLVIAAITALSFLIPPCAIIAILGFLFGGFPSVVCSVIGVIQMTCNRDGNKTARLIFGIVEITASAIWILLALIYFYQAYWGI